MTSVLKSPQSPSQDRGPTPAELERLYIVQRGQSPGTIENEELARFRREWADEVRLKKDPGVKVGNVIRKAKDQEGEKAVDGAREAAGQPGKGKIGNKEEKQVVKKALSPIQPLPAFEPDLDEQTVAGPSRYPQQAHAAPALPQPWRPATKDVRRDAVALYAKAVESEQSGKLNEALLLYRKAFKMDDLVDKQYAKQLLRPRETPREIEEPTPSSTDIVTPHAPMNEPYSFQRHIQMQPDYEKAQPPIQAPNTPSRLSPLTALFSALPVPASEIQFLPQQEELPLPIARLPSELLQQILAHLDVASVERLASTCWRARYLTAQTEVWKTLVTKIYRGPAILPESWEVKDLARRHRGEWRTALIEEERVRMDGCYISICHYLRPGQGDQWVAITHMITYHRFLRFYPDGSVISFLTTDHPSDVVPVLRPSLRAKGLHFGRWRLLRSDSEVDHLPPFAEGARMNEKHRARVVITDLLEPGAVVPKYEFEMELNLRETGRGRWNKLDILNYHSINLATGESLGLSLKHQKPFYFSKVKSYSPSF